MQFDMSHSEREHERITEGKFNHNLAFLRPATCEFQEFLQA